MRNIKTFGILLNISNDITSSLKSGHYICKDNLVFNISLNTLIYYAGLYQQRSFFYCELKDNKVISHYYEKEDVTKPYNKNTNPYILIESSDEYIDASDADEYSELGGKFKYTIPLKYFENIDNKISDNLKILDERYNPDTIIQQSINCVGQWPWYIRQKIYKSLL